MGRFTVAFAVVVALLFASPNRAAAQLKGHYVPGFTGVGNGSQGPPSITVVLPTFVYKTDTIKDDDGNPLGQHPSITSVFTGPGILWVTPVKLFGGNLGGSVIPIAYMKARIEGPSLDVPGSFKFSDIYLQPFQLGWDKPRADVVAGWGFFMPTGEWEQGGSENGGLGMWSNLFQVGTTVRLDNKRQWTASVLGTYEIHSDKKDTDIKVGNIMTIEGGVARNFYKPVSGSHIPLIVTVGVPYYSQHKATADTAPFLNVPLSTRKDHVFGVGAEGSVFIPQAKLLLGLRVVPEFGAVNRTQGVTWVFTIGYQAKSLVKAPPAK